MDLDIGDVKFPGKGGTDWKKEIAPCSGGQLAFPLHPK